MIIAFIYYHRTDVTYTSPCKPLNKTISRILRVATASGLAQEFPVKVKIKYMYNFVH